MANPRNFRGTTFSYPLWVKGKLGTDTTETVGMVAGQFPRKTYDLVADFAEALETFEIVVPLTTIAGAHAQATTAVNSGWRTMPRAGRLVSATYTGVEALAANDTNYLTFTVVNTLGSGSGTTAMLAATDANTTKATGGTGITAVVGRSLTIHGTAANLRVAAGDVVACVETPTGTLANAVTRPTVTLTFATIPRVLTPRITRTAGSPLVAPSASTASGEIVLQLSATNEANVAAVDFGDQVVIDPTKLPVFTCRLKMSAVGVSGTRAVWGLATAYNATLDNIAEMAWFRLEGASLALLAETDDATTDRDDQSTGITMVADTYYHFTIDFSRGTNAIDFYVDDALVSTLNATALTTSMLMQPFIAIQKDAAGGTGTQFLTVDQVRVVGVR